MIKRFLSFAVIALAFAAITPSAQAIGFYVDIPANYKFTDCNKDCSYTPTGVRGAFIFPINLGIGAETWKVDFEGGDSVDFGMFDLSYVLPIPVVNITLGAGVGFVTLNTSEVQPDASINDNSYSDSASQYSVSLGYTIFGPLDIHLGYEKVNAELDYTVETGAVSVPVSIDFSGNLIYIGVMFIF